jgi:hypothetical protein
MARNLAVQGSEAVLLPVKYAPKGTGSGDSARRLGETNSSSIGVAMVAKLVRRGDNQGSRDAGQQDPNHYHAEAA